MAGVPFIFGNATTAIPLTNLDADFNTTATLGNASIGLGNTTTTVGNLTLTNVTITSGSANVTTVGNAAITGGSINNTVIGNVTPSTAFFTTANVTTQLNLTKATDYNLYASGAGANYMAGSLGIGTTTMSQKLNVTAVNATGFAGQRITNSNGNVGIAGVEFSSDTIYAKAAIGLVRNNVNGVGNLNFYNASSTGAADWAATDLAMSIVPSGGVGIGGAGGVNSGLLISKAITGSVASFGCYINATIQSDVTTAARYFGTSTVTQATAFTCANLQHFYAAQGTFGAGSAVTSQIAFYAESSLTGATNNYGFYGVIAAGTSRYNLYMGGTADNYLAGNLGIGVTTPTTKVQIYSSGAPAASGNMTTGLAVAAGGGSFALNIGADATAGYTWINSAYINSSGLASPMVFMGGTAERMRIDTSGNVLITGVGGLGYGTGSGGAVTQATSRTTGVTLNKTNGAITLVSAAGSVTYSSFTVTNSTVAATDTIIVNQKSGTDKYIILVTTVAAGSFQITFATTAGVTTEQPVFNFAVIKAVVA